MPSESASRRGRLFQAYNGAVRVAAAIIVTEPDSEAPAGHCHASGPGTAAGALPVGGPSRHASESRGRVLDPDGHRDGPAITVTVTAIEPVISPCRLLHKSLCTYHSAICPESGVICA